MDLFEFILILTSVIYALAVTQLFSGIGRLAQTRATIRWFLPHTLWVMILFVDILMSWWATWEFRGIEWTFPKFVYMAVAPTLIFFSCVLIFPGRPDVQRVDLEEHFFTVRQVFLPCYFLAVLAAVTDGSVLEGEPLWFPGRIGHIALLGTVLGGLFTEKRWLQSLFAAAVMLALAYIAVSRLWLPR